MARQLPNKKESRIVKKIQEQQQVTDETVSQIAQKDDDIHDKLGDLHNDVMRRMRIRTLRLMKKNGGLTSEQEQELVLLGG